MMGFRDWFEQLQQPQGAKQIKRSPKPSGARSLSMKPAKAANPASAPKRFTGFNAFGMEDYEKQKPGTFRPH